ncbi:MAG: RibD family protein [Brevundimonas sp.]|uniref:RibD family protein n=1 Tax=Brevundimonas sp. TaxID=1871086 RepID=UPI003919A012
MRVTLKLATSLDGRIATASGESKWITGEAARAEGHRLRAEHDAILVGVETVLADDPELTVRLSSPAASRNPLRVILDSRLRTPDSAKVAAANTLILTTASPRSVGQAEVERVADAGRPTPEAALAALSRRGLTSVLIEGGGQVAASFLRAGLVDRIEWFRAPILLGGDGRPGVAGLALAKLAAAPKFRRLSVEALGHDLWERYERI